MYIYMVSRTPLNTSDAQTVHVIELFENLKKKHRVLLFVPKAKLSYFDDPGIFQIPNLNMKFFSVVTFQLLLFYYLARLFRHHQLRPSVMYLRNSIFHISPFISAKIFKVPCIVEINGIIELEMESLNLNLPLFSFLAISLQRWMFKSARKLIAVTSGIEANLTNRYHISPDKITVIGNGANTDLFRPLDIMECRKKIKLNTDELDYHYIGFVGNLAPWQGLETLVLAAGLIVKKRQTVRFLIVGDGVAKDRLISLIKKLQLEDYFILCGKVPYQKVPVYINACNLMVAPFVSKRNKETGLSPLKIYEYIACEKLVIVTRIPNLEFVVNHHCGVLVEPEDPGSLAAEILKLLAIPEDERKKMGRNGRSFVCSNHTWSSIAERVAEVCKK